MRNQCNKNHLGFFHHYFDLPGFLKTLNLIFSKLTLCDLGTFRTKSFIEIFILIKALSSTRF